MDRRMRVVWIFAASGVACGASTFAFMLSPLSRGLLVFSPGVIWSAFSCIALRASSGMSGLVLRPSLRRMLLGALAPVVAYPIAVYAALLWAIPLDTAVGVGNHARGVLFVSVPLLIFTAGIMAMLRVWSGRIGVRARHELAAGGLIALGLEVVLDVFDRPAFGAHLFQLWLVVSVTALLFVVTGRAVARSDVLGDVPA